MARHIGLGVIAVFGLLMATATPAAANKNILSNPGFDGTGGVVVDNVIGDVPDDWRAFAVGGGAGQIEITPLDADSVHPGSPATNGVNWQVDEFGADQGFDNDNGRFEVTPGTTYWNTFYAKSGDENGTDQNFRMGFPIFDASGAYLGREPGAVGGLTATNTWQKFYGPAWTDSEAAQAHISWRVDDDGGVNSVLIALPTAIEATTNILQNPEFSGARGVIVENVTGAAPDRFRAFAVGGGAAQIDTVPLAEGEVFPGSPAVDGVQWQVDVFGADQGFDNEGARFPIVPDEEYHAEFYVKSANADGTDQLFDFGFPIFDENGDFLGSDPGGSLGLTATSEWTKVITPTWSDPVARFGHIAWRVGDDGGDNSILIAMPSVVPPGGDIILPGDVNGDGEVNGLDVDPFVNVLLNGPFQTEADMNEDGVVNGLDVDPFVAAVVGGGVQAVPEPSTCILLAIGGLLLGIAARRRK